MLFNSLDFALFLPIVFFLYWFVFNKKIRLQNALVVFASYVFYGWWDWRFLSLIIFSTLIDYFLGLKLLNETNENKRKIFLGISLSVNLGLLGFFKYYNFFLDNFYDAFSFFGYSISSGQLIDIVLPVGISFYTFQTLSYTIDIYRNQLTPTKDFVAFSAFVSFFPQLVAGPIERATNLLPQFYNKRKFDYTSAVDGLRQILWGLFKKVVIADNCAVYANMIFNDSADYSGSTLFLGAVFFTFQIYGDFSGYSDIAIGASRLFGFNLMQNFAFPYFSRDIAEFWRRWHISLSTWFRDYLYIPLGGSKGTILIQIRNVFIIFLVSGFWHGVNWTFVIWGALNAVYFLPIMILKKNRKNLGIVAEGKVLPSLRDFISIIVTFSLTVIAWVFFRSNDISHAFDILSKIFSTSLLTIPSILPETVLFFLVFFTVIEWLGRSQKYGLEKIGFTWNPFLRYSFYYLLAFSILWYGGSEQEFIYFQF